MKWLNNTSKVYCIENLDCNYFHLIKHILFLRFYLGHWQEGIGKLFSFGGLGVWTIIDVILIAIRYLGPADHSLYIWIKVKLLLDRLMSTDNCTDKVNEFQILINCYNHFISVTNMWFIIMCKVCGVTQCFYSHSCLWIWITLSLLLVYSYAADCKKKTYLYSAVCLIIFFIITITDVACDV